MAIGTGDESFPPAVAALLVLLPIVGGGLLFLVFQDGTIHRLGLFLMGSGVIVGVALVLVQRS